MDIATLDRRPCRQFHVWLHDRIYGPYPPAGLRALPGFTLKTLVCPVGSGFWRPAVEVVDLAAYFSRVGAAFAGVPSRFPRFDMDYGRPGRLRRRMWTRWFKRLVTMAFLGGALVAGAHFRQPITRAASDLTQTLRTPRAIHRLAHRSYDRLEPTVYRVGAALAPLFPSPSPK